VGIDMPAYEYKAITPNGKVITDVMEAQNEQLVTKAIFAKGYRPMAIKKRKTAVKEGESSGVNMEITLFKKKVRSEELVLFTRELVTLLRAGVPMLTALEALASQSGDALGEVLNKIYVAVMSGKSFSQALDQHPEVFPKIYVNSVYAGEMSGSLDEVLERMVQVLQHDEETKKKVKSAMKYPIFVMSAMTGAFFIIMTMVVPKFAAIFQGMGMDLPIFTKILIGLSEFAQAYALYILGFGGAAFVGFKIYTKTDKGRLWWDTILMKMPLSLIHI
jgi:type II secretory pathway component PulF